MPRDWDVVGRVREDCVRVVVVQQRLIRGIASCIRAVQSVASKFPEVTGLRDRNCIIGNMGNDIVFVGIDRIYAGLRFQDAINFGYLEPRQLNRHVEIDQPLKLDCQKFCVPTGLFGQAIVG